MIVLSGPFRLQCYATERGFDQWEGAWCLERVTEPSCVLAEGSCHACDRSEHEAKRTALNVGLNQMDSWFQVDREARGWCGGPAACR